MSGSKDVTAKCMGLEKVDKKFCSHMEGLAQEYRMDWNSDINRNTLPKIVTSYRNYTNQNFKGENLHPGKTIKFSQFVSSALENWIP